MVAGKVVFLTAGKNTAKINLWYGYQRYSVMFYSRGWFYILRYWPFLILITPSPCLIRLHNTDTKFATIYLFILIGV